jgi:hypothetical protein
MRTHRNTSAKLGDVIDVRSAVSGRSYGEPIIVTDTRADANRAMCGEGGWECRTATPAEVKAAGQNVKVVYD